MMKPCQRATRRISVVCFSRIEGDARVLRQVRRLSSQFHVSVVGYGKDGAVLAPGSVLQAVPEPVGFLRRNLTAIPKLIVGRVAARFGYDHWYWDREDRRAAFAALVQSRPDLILANDWLALPAAARAAERTGARIVLDLHEYAPQQLDHSPSWMFLIAPMVDHYLRRYAASISRVTTVNDSIAVRYKDEYGLTASVITNAPEIDLDNAPAFRATEPNRIRLIHHGAPSRDRKLDLSIQAIALMDRRFSLTFMLTDQDPRHVAWLRKLAKRVASGRISFEPAAPPQEVVPTIAQYDMGLHIIPPTNFNYHVALPNKFFECVCAGLAVCVGPSPEMVRLATKHDLGLVAPNFEPRSIADTLNSLTPERIDAMKRNSIVARAHLNATAEMDKLERLCREALDMAPESS